MFGWTLSPRALLDDGTNCAISALKYSVILFMCIIRFPPRCIFRSAITKQVGDVGRGEEQCFRQTEGLGLVLWLFLTLILSGVV